MNRFDGIGTQTAWDRYFMEVCELVSKRTKCFSRKCGAVIVRANHILATGYNGPPKGIPHCDQRWVPERGLSDYGCPRKALGAESGERLDLCLATHAEVNAIVNAARMGIMVDGAIMYHNTCIPCSHCLGYIINSGIKEVVVKSRDLYDDLSDFILRWSNLTVREVL